MIIGCRQQTQEKIGIPQASVFALLILTQLEEYLSIVRIILNHLNAWCISSSTCCQIFQNLATRKTCNEVNSFSTGAYDSDRLTINTATDLQVPLMKTCNGQRAFSYCGAGVWNHSDSDVKQASSFVKQAHYNRKQSKAGGEGEVVVFSTKR